MGQLSQYLQQVAHKPFQWGSHDCLTFANEAARCSGREFADEYLQGYRCAKSALRAYRRAQKGPFNDVIALANARLTPFDGLFPPNGAIVARESNGPLGYVFGVSWNGAALFVGDNGLENRAFAISDRFWT